LKRLDDGFYKVTVTHLKPKPKIKTKKTFIDNRVRATQTFIDTRETSTVRAKLEKKKDEEDLGKFNGSNILAEAAKLPHPQTKKFNRDQIPAKTEQ
jgi:hypothetical protein